ncbi:MAG: two-component system, chemotaxis family, sensor kinase CheA [Desulfobacteraceae bacterium Eth-SRB2]|nr:MAG: two-component system, chemotaxis family, sensor kinase CheA [Desulfobacteraceae bacterium Eth-SRB2]
MSDLIDNAKEKIEAISLEVVTMEENDIPAMGKILNLLCDMEKDAEKIGRLDFSDLISGLNIYLEKAVLGEIDNFELFEQGVEHLSSIHRCIRNHEEYKEDISGILNKLGVKRSDSGEETKESQNNQTEIESDTETESFEEDESDAHPDDKKEIKEDIKPPDQDLSTEDREILSDFVMESLESLETVEVSLMDLEQDPGDLDSINAIFRSFHTIKGVSAFLNLDRINMLAHRAENLLDKARSGEISIEATVIDIILESVDSLKKLIVGVQKGLENGISLDMGLDVTPLVNRIDEVQEKADQIGDKPVGEIMIQKGEITPKELEKGLQRQKQEPGKKIGQILVEDKSVESKSVVGALRDQKKTGMRHMDLQVKVDTKKLDNLVDLTGELVIAQSMLRQNPVILAARDQKLMHNLGQLNQITSGLQTTAMAMRMVPIKSTFQKMVRLVRDLAKNSGKQVKLEMSGEDTEIDRNVVDELYEPMVHMIRNSVDHGIGTPEQRKKAGKNKNGAIHLIAYHQAGNIVVEISDDGQGLNKDRIIEKAKANHLIIDESKLSESEIYNLIFQPGFSTAKQVTDVSGRGVGMDVVKKGIEKLRGKVEINSRLGRGSTFIISLPLTLAIIEGMVVRVGKERFIIPALSILESLRPTKKQYSTVEGKGEMILSRGKLIPLIRLDQIFNIKSDSFNPWEALVVVVEYEDRQICLFLDELLGKEEVVIKSLGETLKDTKGIAGGAIMGDGKVGLILDMAGIWDLVMGVEN